MSVLVSDTSIIIDLERGRLLEDLFLLPFEFVVPDLLFRRELSDDFGERLLALGLRVEELEAEELSRAIELRRERTTLSTPDVFAFALAEQRSWILLTGDSALRQAAEQHGIPTHGVLWICDRFAEHAVVDDLRLHAGLLAIADHPRCRLPKGEIKARLVQFAAG